MEEMRRVLAFFAWKAKTWEARTSQRQDTTDELQEGLSAYAARQAAIYDALRLACRVEWINTSEMVLEGERKISQRRSVTTEGSGSVI